MRPRIVPKTQAVIARTFRIFCCAGLVSTVGLLGAQTAFGVPSASFAPVAEAPPSEEPKKATPADSSESSPDSAAESPTRQETRPTSRVPAPAAVEVAPSPSPPAVPQQAPTPQSAVAVPESSSAEALRVPAATSPYVVPQQNSFLSPAAAETSATGSSPSAVESTFDVATPENKPSEESWRVSVEGVTRLPVDIGIQVRLQSPYWFRLTAGLGTIPGTFVDAATDTLESKGAFDAATASIISSAFGDGSTWNVRLGIRPSERFGFYGDVGLARVALEGRLQLDEVVPADLLQQVPVAVPDSFEYQLETQVNLFLLEAGWEGHIGRHLLFGVGIGLLLVNSSTSSVRSNFEPPDLAIVQTRLTEAETEAIDTIGSSIDSFGVLPTISLRLGVDFF